MSTKTSHKTSVNYSGRTVDLLLLQYIQAPTASVRVIPDISNTPRIVTGIEKLVQRYTLLFLTDIGSIENRRSEGSDFIPGLRRGEVYDENTLEAVAARANSQVQQQIRQEDRSLNTPPDEALDSSSILEVSLDRHSAAVSVTVKLVSLAGDEYIYTTPISRSI